MKAIEATNKIPSIVIFLYVHLTEKIRQQSNIVTDYSEKLLTRDKRIIHPLVKRLKSDGFKVRTSKGYLYGVVITIKW